MTSSPALGARLFLTSATVLFVELLLIRWIPANVVYVGFFNNFVLMASFLGIGLGIVLGRRSAGWSIPIFGPLLLGLAVVIHAARVEIQGPDLFFGASQRMDLKSDVLVVVYVIGFVTAAMAALSAPLAGLLRSMPPLRAYAIDIAGSMCGIAAFSALAFAGAGPAAWLAVVLLLVVALGLLSGRRRSAYVGCGAVAATLGLTIALDRGELWSPYYRIELYPNPVGATALGVNGIPHQTMWSFRSTDKEPYFDQVYEWLPGRRFESVLVVGAGSGTDVAVALARGAGRVDAVEIDPTIQRIGAALHPDRPYADARAHTTLADGRAFLRSTSDRYDLIVFAATDSLTLVTSTANLRLESFLFTEEAFASVRDHLTPDGVFILYNWYREPWLVDRYGAMLQRVFGEAPAVRLYAAGEVHAAALGAGPGLRSVTRTVMDSSQQSVHDDAPFPYLRTRSVPPSGLVALGILVAGAIGAAAFATHVGRTSIRHASVHFFLLGAAFMLLETKSLVTFSLLFGATWLVNALVFFAILASVLVAIFVSSRVPRRDPRWYYAGLFASLAVGYLVRPADLLLEPAVLRYALASAVTFAPVFFANLVFARSFRDSRAADMAFASNLVGAMAGGAIEWAALAIGYHALALVVAALYLCAYATTTRVLLLGDRVDLGEIRAATA